MRGVGRSLIQLIVVALIGLLAITAAPAFSLRPYLPPARDFEQPLPTVHRVATPAKSPAAHEEGPVTHRSAPIAAPHRFDLVGLAGEMRPLELRVRGDGTEWSPWVETANGDPVYTGGSEEVQIRTRGWRPEGTLHYVNVSGTATLTDSLLTGAREALSTAFISVAEVVSPVARAEAPRPPIVRREEWGANRDTGGCPPRTSPVYGSVKAAVVHHTVTTNTYSEAEAPSIVLGICRYHRNANGWNDIGYNALVDRFGNVYEGRAGGLRRAVVGAHAQGFNSQTTGTASIGDHTGSPISDRAMAGFTHFLAWKLEAHGLDAEGGATLVSGGGSASRYPSGTSVHVNRILGHRRLNYTACPGDSLKAQLERMRARTQRRMESHT
jgi:hypothetical protein